MLGAVDIDSLSVKTYKANHSEVNVFETDISVLNPSEFKKTLGLSKKKLDLLAGCPPCQGFSTMRTLNGALDIDDPRNNLLFEFQRFVEELLPRAIMLENVPGLAQDKRFSAFLRRMNKLGYKGEYRILNAADYGVPQRRQRLIYLAGRSKKISFAFPLRKRKTVRDAIGALPKAGESGDAIHDLTEHRSPLIIERIKNIPKDGGSRYSLPEDLHLNCHQKCNGFKDVYGRMAWDKVAPTITTGCFNPSKGRFLHPEEDRAITMREAALLQGFPRSYKFLDAKNKSGVALMIGNALPPPFIAAHALSIIKAINKKR